MLYQEHLGEDLCTPDPILRNMSFSSNVERILQASPRKADPKYFSSSSEESDTSSIAANKKRMLKRSRKNNRGREQASSNGD